MEGKETAKKVWMKTGFGILFVAACFIAMYILMEFHGDLLMVGIAAVLLLISAFLFMNAVFSDKAKKLERLEEQQEETGEVLSGSGDGEFRLKITKHMKEMESTQKELIEVLKNQNTLIQAQIENLEHEIYMLSEKQVNQTKSVIKFNKENARQLAISERETLEYVMLELKKAIKDKSGTELFAVSDLAGGDEELVMPEVPAEEPAAPVEEIPVVEEIVAPVAEEPVAAEEEPLAEEKEIPEMPEDIDLSELFDIPELYDSPEETPAEEISVPEAVEETAPAVEEKAEEPVPAADPLAGMSADPNAMMTPEDIAKLLEAMGQ